MQRWIRSLGVLVMGAVLGSSTPAMAGDPQPVVFTVYVKDEAGAAIPTATVRHRLEASRNPVNSVDGSWKASELYLPDGTVHGFLPGQEESLEVSAPGYLSREFTYLMRKRKNAIDVVLVKMELKMEADEEDDPVIQFGRDKPIDGASANPAP